MKQTGLLPFLLLASLAHLALLVLAPRATDMASDATGSLRVTLLVPQQPAAPSHKKATSRHTPSVALDPTHLASLSGTITKPVAPDHSAIDANDEASASALSTPGQRPRADVRGRQIRIHLDRALQASFHYPLIAQRQGWQGEVRVALTVRADGLLANIHVSQSSGYAILDDAAMESIRQIRAIPEAVAALNGEAIDLILPVRYELRSS